MTTKNLRKGSAVVLVVVAGISLLAGNFAPLVYATGGGYTYYQPPVVHITANPASIPYNGSSVLTWTSSYATACNASGGWTGSKSLSGSQTVNPSVTTNFVIICSNPKFQTSDSVIVEVRPQDPPTVTLTANPTTITSGNSSLLTWSSTNADHCTASGGWTGEVPLSGTRSVSPNAYTEYTIVCANSVRQASARAAVNVLIPPPTVPPPPPCINSGVTGSVVKNYATLNVPQNGCQVKVSFSSYKHTGTIHPFENQILYDNITKTYGPGTHTIGPVDLSCNWQTDLYFGGVVTHIPSGGHGSSLIAYDYVEHKNCNIPTPPPTTPPPPPTPVFPTVHITATPMSIAFGETSVLQWTSTNATQCSATLDWSGAKALSGTQIVQPNVTQTYSIICSNSYAQVSDSVVVTVRSDGVPSVNIVANPPTIDQGGSSILSWTSDNARTCVASGGWSGTVALSGSRAVSPTIYTEYTIICSNNTAQASDRASVAVRTSDPVLPPTLSLVASPQTIFQGNSSILSWSSANATNCTATNGWSGSKTLSGSETVAPGLTTSYSMTCTGPGGTVSANTLVNVNQNQQTQLPSVNISSNPSSITQGNSSILNWSSSNATQCYASNGWSGNVSLSGSQSVTPGNTTVYQITCSNSSGQASAQTTVYVNYQPQTQLPTVTISSNPSVINFGQSSILNWFSSNATYCYTSGGWSSNVSLSGSQSVSPSISTTYLITCSNGSGQVSAQTTVYVNNQQSLTPTVNLNALPDTINRGQTALLVWSSTNATQCYAYGGWSGAKALSGSETVSPTANTTYSINCSNASGQTSDTDTIFVNNILFEPPTLTPLFTAACVISPSITQVNRTVTIAAGQSGGTAPYSYFWSGDVSGSGASRNFIFSTTGIKTVRLTVTDGTGKTAQATCQTQVNPAVIITPPPQTPPPPPVITVSTPPPAPCNCPTVQVVQAPVCRTYTTCSDGQTYEGGSGQAPAQPTNPNNFIYNSGANGGQVVPTDQGQLPQTQVAAVETNKGSGNSLVASLFMSKEGTPSRLTFLVVWYVLILFFVGFMALIYSAVLKRA